MNIIKNGSLVEDNVENRLEQTFFVVEATSHEQFTFWQTYASNSPCRPRDTDGPGMEWEQVNPGWLVTVGKLDNRPCCISTSWVKIDGVLVMFWYDCSQVTDCLQTEKWLKENFKGRFEDRPATCDASNFFHCISAIETANKR